MNKSKKYLIPLFLISLLAIGIAMTPTKNVVALPTVCPISSIYITIEGWELAVAEGGGMMAEPKFLKIKTELTLDAHINQTEPIIVSLTPDSFSEADQKPSNFQTDGITMTYSDGIITTSTGLRGEAGLYQTLASTSEESYTQSDYGRESAIYTFYTAVPFHTTITEYMENIDSSYTHLNFTVTALYATLLFDRTPTDAFYTEAAARTMYDEYAEDFTKTTSQLFTTALFDPVFDNHIAGIIYAPFNHADMLQADASWNPAKEVRSVLGGNATDTSINGTISITDIRNALYGHIGQYKTPVVGGAQGLQGLPDPTLPSESPIYGFRQTISHYYVDYNIMSGFASSPVNANYTCLFGLFVPTEAQLASGKDIWFWGDSAVVASMAGAGMLLLSLIVVNIPKLKVSTRDKWFWVLGSTAAAWFVTFIMVAMATKLTYIIPP